MKNVTFIVYNIYGLGGTVRTTVDLANYLVSHGFTVNIISTFYDGRKPRMAIDGRVRLIPLINRKRIPLYGRALSKFPSWFEHASSDMKRVYSVYSDLLLLKTLARLKTDFIICSTPNFARAALAAPTGRARIVMQEHVGVEIHTPEYFGYISRLLKRADFVHCVNHRDAELLRDMVDENLRAFTIYNTVQTTERRGDPDGKTIISTGRLAHQKNYQALVRAFTLFRATRPGWKLKIVADGQEKESICQVIRQNRVSNDVFMIPATEKVFDELATASMYVCSSRYESFCISIMEAMSLGIPCVSYACHGPGEYLNGDNGVVVPQGDTKALAAAMGRLADAPELRAKLGKGAVETAAKFTMDRIGPQWLEFFRTA